MSLLPGARCLEADRSTVGGLQERKLGRTGRGRAAQVQDVNRCVTAPYCEDAQRLGGGQRERKRRGHDGFKGAWIRQFRETGYRTGLPADTLSLASHSGAGYARYARNPTGLE